MLARVLPLSAVLLALHLPNPARSQATCIYKGAATNNIGRIQRCLEIDPGLLHELMDFESRFKAPLAVESRYFRTISRFLLDKGATPDLSFRASLKAGWVPSVRAWLIRDPSLLDKKVGADGKLPLFLAMDMRDERVVDVLLTTNRKILSQRDREHRFTPLYYAAMWDDVNVVATLLRHGAKPNEQDSHGQTALHVARSPAVVRILLDAKANPNARDKDGNTPLHRGFVVKVRLLLEHGADLEIKNREGQTPLDARFEYLGTDGRTQLAPYPHEMEAGRLLYARGAKPGLRAMVALNLRAELEKALSMDANALKAYQKKWSEPLIIWCGQAGASKDIIRLLRDHKQDPKATGFFEENALYHAVRYGHLETATELLAQGLDPNYAPRSFGDSFDIGPPLPLAVRAGNYALAKLLIDHKADIKAGNLIVDAIHANSLDLVKLLLDKGLLIVGDERGLQYPLHIAAVNDRKAIFDLLLDRGANIHFASGSNSVLHAAAQGGNVKIIEYLLKKKIAVDVENSAQQRPLHLAAQHARGPAAALLLANKADINARDKFGFTPLDYAVKAFRYVEEHPEVYLDKKPPVVECLHHMLKQVPDGSPALKGEPRLHWAVRQDLLDLVELLLKDKLDPNAKNKSGETPLDLAVAGGDLLAADQLLLHGADPNAKDPAGDAPLHVAARKGYSSMVKLLLANKANVTLRNTKNQTALDIARTQGHQTVTILLKNKLAKDN